jgi:outer membrane lipoprotein LolB
MILRKISRIVPILHGLGRVAHPALWSAVFLLLALAACAPVKPRLAVAGDQARQAARETELARHPNWSFVGRLAVSQGSNGGSARIEWHQDGADFDIQLSAPITRQSWHLRQRAGKVSLEGMEGGTRKGIDAEALLQEATGWRIPLAAMSAWVRGARAGSAAEFSSDPAGLPATLSEQGWSVEYRGWRDGTLALPQKVFARNGPASVRLLVESWSEP